MMRRALSTWTLCALAAATPALAQDPFEDLPGMDDPLEGLDEGGASSSAYPRVSGLRGFLETRGRFFFKDDPRAVGRNDEQWIQELQLEFDLEIAPSLSGFFRPRFLVDVLDDDLVRTEPLEAYVTWDLGDHELRAGQLVENWGIADTFNPIDVLNRRDVAEDPIDPIRLGELGVRYRWFLPGGDVIGEPTISVYVMPVFRKAVFPGDDSRWSFNPRSAANPSAPVFDEDRGNEPNGRDRVFYALRAQSTVSTGIANADVQLLASLGPERFPQLEFAPGTSGNVLAPTYFGLTTVGGGLRAVPNAEALADYTLKAEVVYKTPFRFDGRPFDLPDDYLQYAFGFDRLFPNVFSDKDQITATVEWVGEIGASDLTSVYRPFDDDLVLRLLWEANDFDRQSFELRGFADFEKQEYLVEGLYQTQLRSIHEDLQLELGVRWFDIATGEPGFFSTFPNNSSAWVSFRFDF